MDMNHNRFSEESEVLAEIAAAGYFPVTLDFPAETNEDHRHYLDSLVYIIDGELGLTDTLSGERCVCGKVTMIRAPRGVPHREETLGHGAIIGLSVKPEELSQPVNEPPPVRPA